MLDADAISFFRKDGTQFPFGPQDVDPDQTLQGAHPDLYLSQICTTDNYPISGRLFNDLCTAVKGMTARAGANTNVWLAFPYKPSFYPDPAKPGNRVAQYTLFVFTHAHKAARGVTVDKLICYYFPVSAFLDRLEGSQTSLGVLGRRNPN
jgi:hypothetical protein